MKEGAKLYERTLQVLNAHRVARAFTGRALIAKFEGSYHGIDGPAVKSLSRIPVHFYRESLMEYTG
jgi:glutamate-1-semialdehyde aminotransferase